MGGVIDNISFSDRQYMLRVFDFIDSMIIKSTYDADEHETLESRRNGEQYILAIQKRDSLLDYFSKLDVDTIRNSGIHDTKAKLFDHSKEAFFNSLTRDESDKLLNKLREWRIRTYVETNPYYLILNGEPTCEEEIVMVKDTFEGGDVPLHKLSFKNHAAMWQYLINDNYCKLNEIIASLKGQGRNYEYLDHLKNRISYSVARSAKNFQILYYDRSILNASDIHNFFTEYERSGLCTNGSVYSSIW